MRFIAERTQSTDAFHNCPSCWLSCDHGREREGVNANIEGIMIRKRAIQYQSVRQDALNKDSIGLEQRTMSR